MLAHQSYSEPPQKRLGPPLPPFPLNFRCPPCIRAGGGGVKGTDIICNSTLFRISQKPHPAIVYYLLPSRWIPVLALIYLLPLRSVCLFTLQRRTVEIFPVYIEGFTFKIVAAHLRGVTEIAPKSPFYICEQKPHLAWFCVSTQKISVRLWS